MPTTTDSDLAVRPRPASAAGQSAASAPAPRLATDTPIVAVYAIAFTVGGASLGVEIAAARLLAPYFGATTIVWANTIATVLIGLAAGYALGGKLADRWASLRGLCRLVLAAAVLLALLPFGADPFLSLAVSAVGALSTQGFLASLVAVLTLLSLPVVLLGTVAPYANRLALGSVTDTGTVTGRLYAISTVGALCGTFLSALVLVPFVGTHRTFIVFALVLAATAAASARSLRLLLVPAAIGMLLWIAPLAIGSSVPGARVVYATETPYQDARVLQFKTGERWLEINEGIAVQSIYRPWSYLTGGPLDDYTVLPFAADRGAPSRIAILGDAAGSVARAYGHFFPGTRVDAVELDPALTSIGRRYFGLHGPRLHLYTADARPWLAATSAHYGAIFLDAYRQPYIPFYLATREFFRSVQRHLARGGVLIVNVGHVPGSAALERVVSATLRSVFPVVVRDEVGLENSLVMASGGPLSEGGLRAAGRLLPVGLRPLAASVARRLAPALRGGVVYTDDRAPVEWLTDLSIIHYATR